MTGVAFDARQHLSQLVGKEIPTMSGKPNRIHRVSGDDVVVGTTRSPEGRPVPIEWVQNAMDQLIEERELEIKPESVGYGVEPDLSDTTRDVQLDAITAGRGVAATTFWDCRGEPPLALWLPAP